MNKSVGRTLLSFSLLIFLLFNLLSLQAREASAAGVYGMVPGKWSLNKQGYRDEFIPATGYGKGVYAVEGLFADVLLALDTDGEGFAECRKVTGKQSVAQPVAEPNCDPQGPICEAFPYKCSSELVRPLFIETDIRPTSSERLKWRNSARPISAFKPVIAPEKGIRPFYFERYSKPKALDGKTLLHGAWLIGPKVFHLEPDESCPASVFDHYGRALYLRDKSGIKFLAEPSIDFGVASAFEPAMKDACQGEGEPVAVTINDDPQYDLFHKIYIVPGGYWLEIDWRADFEGAGTTMHTLILQVIDGKTSVFTSAQETRMY